jgi:hypothetical protein
MTQTTDLSKLVTSSLSLQDLTKVLSNVTKGRAEGVQDEETVGVVVDTITLSNR